MWRLRAFSLAVFALLVFSCGKKGPPTYVSEARPGAYGLSVRLKKGVVTLYWGYSGPPTNLFRIYKMGRKVSCPACLERFVEVSPKREGGLFYYEDRSAKPGGRYCYKVIPLSSSGEFGTPSNVYCFDYTYFPPPPDGIKVKPLSGGCILRWIEREHVTGYNIYRWKEGEKPPRFPVNRVIVRGDSYLDAGVPKGRYNYCMTSIFLEGGLYYEGPCSNPIAVEVRGIMPPPPPIGVVAVPRDIGIFISWSPGGDEVYSYSVYRSTNGTDFELITPKPITKIYYIDRDVAKGITYYYRVRAYHRGFESGPGSLFSKVVKVTYR